MNKQQPAPRPEAKLPAEWLVVRFHSYFTNSPLRVEPGASGALLRGQLRQRSPPPLKRIVRTSLKVGCVLQRVLGEEREGKTLFVSFTIAGPLATFLLGEKGGCARKACVAISCASSANCKRCGAREANSSAAYPTGRLPPPSHKWGVRATGLPFFLLPRPTPAPPPNPRTLI